MQENSGQSVLPAHERAELLLRAGELRQAREAARAGLDQEGPHAGLYLVLGRAHAAEDEDDHDTEAEQAYRAGLDAFPDDLDLLAAYAEFGLAGDVMDQPGRRARGQRAADRLNELAPDSPQAGRLAATGQSGAARPASQAHIQRYDVKTALNSGVDLAVAAAQAREAAEAWPHDRRLAVRAETLTALERPYGHLSLVRATLRAPYRTALIICSLVSAWMLALPLLHLPLAAGLWALPALIPVRLEQALLRGARRRAERRMPADTGLPAPGAPAVPPPTRGERTMLALTFVVAVCAISSAFTWQYARATDYPHYKAAVPRTFQGMPLRPDAPMADELETYLAGTTLPRGVQSFSGVYGEGDRDSARAVAVVGATGDLHAEDPDDLYAGLDDLGFAGLTLQDSWSASPGPLGGRLECFVHGNGTGALSMCAWVDKGSVGVVLVPGETEGRDSLARTARALRKAVLRPRAAEAV
ncbi:tetratricopeptide repeat protein [Streptomyces sp. NPDC050145]|uniref:tetratricopeptide repeat protein n=1 Tax=Streptomyces sp. NPDC050145 TaxID=3365602 RepID=UPI0037AE5807